MKENQKAIKILNCISVTCLLLIIVFALILELHIFEKNCWIPVCLEWFVNLFFAILTGAIVSLIIAIINYKTHLKKQAELLVFLIYKQSISLYTTLFSEDKKLTIKKANEISKVYSENVQEIYSIINEIELSAICTKKTKRQLWDFRSLFLKQYNFFANFDKYIYLYKEDFKLNSKIIYKLLMEEIEDETIYDKSVILARKLGGNIYKMDDFCDKAKLRQELADKFKRLVDATKLKR